MVKFLLKLKFAYNHLKKNRNLSQIFLSLILEFINTSNFIIIKILVKNYY